MSVKNTLLTIVVSAGVGAVAGILFAPDRGDKTRRDLSRKSKKTQQDLTKKGRDFADMARHEFEDYLDNLRNKYESTKRFSDDLIEKGEAIADEIKGKLK